MDNHPSSARPHSRIPNYVISANRQSSSASEERTRNAWIKANAEEESSSASEERTLNAWIKANEEEESSSASEERTHNAWIKLNDKEESSSASEERTLNAWIKANEEEESSSASEERTLNAWVKTNEEDLLKAIANDETAEMTPGTCPSTVVGYWATEDTDKDLRFILGVIYKEFGPIRMQYDRCDMSDNHWVSGWETVTGAPDVQRVVICVKMDEAAERQSPALGDLTASMEADEEDTLQEVRDGSD